MSITGWISVLAGAMTILTFVTGILFFSIGKPFGFINDVSALLQMILYIPLAGMLVRLTPANVRPVVIAAAAVGIAGALYSAVGQGLLVFRVIDFEGSTRFFPGGAAVGLWLVVFNLQMLLGNYLPGTWPVVGILAGVFYIALVAGFLRGGTGSPVFIGASALLGIAFPVWSIRLGVISGL